MNTIYINKQTGLQYQINDQLATPGYVHMYRQGGSFGMKVPQADFELHFEPAPAPVWKKSHFTCEGMGVVLPGYTNGQRWNGWQVPAFEKAAVDILMAETNAPDFVIHAWKEGEPATLVFEDMQEKQLGSPVEDYRTEYAPVEIEVDGIKVTTYPFGDGWCWDECPQEKADEGDMEHGYLATPRGGEPAP